MFRVSVGVYKQTSESTVAKANIPGLFIFIAPDILHPNINKNFCHFSLGISIKTEQTFSKPVGVDISIHLRPAIDKINTIISLTIVIAEIFRLVFYF